MTDCDHLKTYYSVEHDNYYCSACKVGMGILFYAKNRFPDTIGPAIVQLEEERDKLQKFKYYTHDRLTAAGVSLDPESSHRAEGCRIGGRLDEVFAVQGELLAACELANSLLDNLMKSVRWGDTHDLDVAKLNSTLLALPRAIARVKKPR